ncbi:MAG TPA: IPT/TIG domain-containing protein [Candidatus Acidoferrales bacterium]|nr:IPT/TIG domain-containing protein [Candidatus Acidoferrales bacterium]
MAQVPASHSDPRAPAARGTREKASLPCSKWMLASFGILFVMLLLTPLSFGQSAPRITSVAPITGRVNDSITLTGENLGKSSVAGVFLSDDKNDYKAALVDQSPEKIVIKVPQVKPGGYNVSIQVGAQIYIEPVRFTVQG